LSQRTFLDSHGRTWQVWRVIPQTHERRRKSEPLSGRPERRKQHAPRAYVGEQWATGWLVFETADEKRRLAPVPKSWATATQDELERLCEIAEPAKVRPRRLIE